MIDYEVLRFIWWLLIGVLLIGFAVTDGFDMGVGMLTRFLGRNDTERRIMINVDHDSTLGVITTEETGEHPHPHVETIRDSKTDQQNTDQQPPDKTQYFIIDHLMTPVLALHPVPGG